jgi:hypothetical protein
MGASIDLAKLGTLPRLLASGLPKSVGCARLAEEVNLGSSHFNRPAIICHTKYSQRLSFPPHDTDMLLPLQLLVVRNAHRQ